MLYRHAQCCFARVVPQIPVSEWEERDVDESTGYSKRRKPSCVFVALPWKCLWASTWNFRMRRNKAPTSLRCDTDVFHNSVCTCSWPRSSGFTRQHNCEYTSTLRNDTVIAKGKYASVVLFRNCSAAPAVAVDHGPQDSQDNTTVSTLAVHCKRQSSRKTVWVHRKRQPWRFSLSLPEWY